MGGEHRGREGGERSARTNGGVGLGACKDCDGLRTESGLRWRSDKLTQSCAAKLIHPSTPGGGVFSFQVVRLLWCGVVGCVFGSNSGDRGRDGLRAGSEDVVPIVLVGAEAFDGGVLGHPPAPRPVGVRHLDTAKLSPDFLASPRSRNSVTS